MKIMEVVGRFEAPAQRVWSIVSDFGGLGRWNPAVASCATEGHGIGMLRIFTTPAATVTERLVARDDASMCLVYEIVSGSPIKVRDARVAIIVKPEGENASSLTWELTGEPDGMTLSELAQQTEKRYRARLEDLRNCLNAPT
jgi:hypothetical protein